MRVLIALLGFLALQSTTMLRAQSDDVEFLDNRVFYSRFYVADFFSDSTSKWVWELDAVYRTQSTQNNNNFFSDPLRASVRPWVGYQITKQTRISVSPIASFNSAPRFSQDIDLDDPFERELRSTLQINNYAYYNRFNFTHRLRFESRWRGLDNADWPETAWDHPRQNFRARYRLRTRIPLNNDYFFTNNTWYICQYSELHVEFGRDFGSNYFSQNRHYLGIGYRFWDWARMEIGYIQQFNTRENNVQVDVSRGIMVYVFIDWLSNTQQRK
jgi:hypothetical protein